MCKGAVVGTTHTVGWGGNSAATGVCVLLMKRTRTPMQTITVTRARVVVAPTRVFSNTIEGEGGGGAGRNARMRETDRGGGPQALK